MTPGYDLSTRLMSAFSAISDDNPTDAIDMMLQTIRQATQDFPPAMMPNADTLADFCDERLSRDFELTDADGLVSTLQV